MLQAQISANKATYTPVRLSLFSLVLELSKETMIMSISSRGNKVTQKPASNNNTKSRNNCRFLRGHYCAGHRLICLVAWLFSFRIFFLVVPIKSRLCLY